MKTITKILLAVFLLLVIITPAYAHKVILEPVEDGIIKISYEDGSISSRMQVTVYDSNGTEVLAGGLDENGYFYYDVVSDAALIVADDGLGHRLEWQVGEHMVYSNHTAKWMKMALVVLSFIGFGLFFLWRSKKFNGLVQ